MFHYWSHSTENKVKLLAEAIAFHEHREERESSEEEEELSAEISSEEELSDADQQQQQLPGEPKTPPKSK